MTKATKHHSYSSSSHGSTKSNYTAAAMSSNTASFTSKLKADDLSPDLKLGLSIVSAGPSTSRGQASADWPQIQSIVGGDEGNDENGMSNLFVKVYMEGIPIGRKLDVLAHDGYHDLIKTLNHMFDTSILWGDDMDGIVPEKCHVLTYEDEEGDLMMVGDVPWEMFLSTVKRLKITRVDPYSLC